MEKEPEVDKIVEDNSYTRILGANVQGNLIWQAHLETGEKALLPAVRKHLVYLRHMGRLIPMRSRTNLASWMILSRLTYLMPLWGGAAESYITRAQRVLNSAARWAKGLTKRTRISELMEKAGWMTLKEQVRVATAIQTWKLAHLGTPSRMTVDTEWRMQTAEPRLQYSEECYRWRACKEWNELPQAMRELESFARTKKQVKTLVLEERRREPG